VIIHSLFLQHYKTEKVEPYFAIAQHYGWALKQIFNKLSYDSVIIVEGIAFVQKLTYTKLLICR
jgi:hypothetical protein